MKIKELEIQLNNEHDEKLEYKNKIEYFTDDNINMTNDYETKIILLESSIKKLNDLNSNLNNKINGYKNNEANSINNNSKHIKEIKD